MLLKNASILVVDDDTDVLTAVRLLLKTEVKEVVVEKKPENLRNHLSTSKFDVVLLDMNFNSSIHSGNEGFFWLKEIKSYKHVPSVIMITAYGEIDLAIRALKEGASDFIVKPWHNEKLLGTIKETLQKKNHKQDAGAAPANSNRLIGESPAMQQVFKTLDKVAPTDANILILGENGTGKDLIAQAIHQKSLRRQNECVKVDVGALTESLFESELFGYKKGAFTDAREDRAGRFEMADKGTLFLDEIGNIPLHLQTKLLSVLQNRQFNRLGSNDQIPVNIRLITATNVPISELSNEQKFRKDLMYRINTVAIMVPPLRQRGDDIMLLAHHFRNTFNEKYGKTVTGFDSFAEKKLMQYSYPGNVRELQSAIERAVIMAEEDVLNADDIFFSSIDGTGTTDISHETNLSVMEKNTIMNVIEKHQGNISKAARELGLTRTALYRRLNKYDL